MSDVRKALLFTVVVWLIILALLIVGPKRETPNPTPAPSRSVYLFIQDTEENINNG